MLVIVSEQVCECGLDKQICLMLGRLSEGLGLGDTGKLRICVEPDDPRLGMDNRA